MSFALTLRFCPCIFPPSATNIFSCHKLPVKSLHESGVNFNSQVVVLPQTSLIAFLGANDEAHSKMNQGSETLEDAKFDLHETEEKINLYEQEEKGMSEDFWSITSQLQLEEDSLEDLKPLPVAETVDLSQVKGSVYLDGIREFRWPAHLDAPNFHTMGWRRSAGQVILLCLIKTFLSHSVMFREPMSTISWATSPCSRH